MKSALMRSISVLMAFIMLLSLSACEDKPSGQPSPSTPTPSGSVSDSEKTDASLTSLRELMCNDEHIALAAAYLGYREKTDESSLSDWLWENMPGLTEAMPFMRLIPPERVLGGDSGDLYCVVPRDESTSLAVNRVKWLSSGGKTFSKTDEVLYRSENAEPILVFVSREQSGEKPEIEINAVAGNGAGVTWYPVLYPDSGEYNIPTGDDGAALILNFSRFGDIGGFDYGDDGWFPPTNQGLADTVWSFGEWTIELNFGDGDPDYAGTVRMYCDEIAYSGAWRMEDDCLRMELSAGVGTSSSGSYPVLIPPSGEYLQIFSDAKTGACPPFFGEGMTSVTLFLSYG